jgi:hypothetical protein
MDMEIAIRTEITARKRLAGNKTGKGQFGGRKKIVVQHLVAVLFSRKPSLAVYKGSARYKAVSLDKKDIGAATALQRVPDAVLVDVRETVCPGRQRLLRDDDGDVEKLYGEAVQVVDDQDDGQVFSRIKTRRHIEYDFGLAFEKQAREKRKKPEMGFRVEKHRQ